MSVPQTVHVEGGRTGCLVARFGEELYQIAADHEADEVVVSDLRLCKFARILAIP